MSPEMPGAMVFGISDGTAEQPRLRYLANLVPVTDEILDLVAPVMPTEVMRFGGPCAGSQCGHFDGTNCSLVRRVIRELEPVADNLPPCALRSACRWWAEQGREACVRCPQVVSLCVNPTEAFAIAAAPPTGSG